MTREIRLNLKVLHIVTWLACALPIVPAWAGEDTGAGPAGSPFFTVTNTNNNGAGSLRQAIIDANASETISVIPGDGPHVIQPASLLPALTVPTLIDGLSQDGADCTTWPPTLKIELSGTNLTAGSTIGLHLGAGSGGSVVRGLVIRDFGNDNASTGLLISSNANHVACNFIGTDVTGTTAAGNTRGITLSSSRSNVIGTEAGWSGRHERNLISGNDSIGIMTVGSNASDNRISGNWIGTDVTGTGALGGSFGISIGAPGGTPTQNIVIGYDGAGDPVLMRNVISGNGGAGIRLGNNTRRFHVAGNYIGLNAEGTAALANGRGIESTAGSSAGPRLYHLIGWDGTPGQRAAQRNVISGNGGTGVSIRFVNDTGNDHAVVGNWIGTDAQGQSAIPNGFYGLSLTGGSAPTRVLVHGNRIADNAAGGIQLYASSSNQHPAFWNGVDIPELPNLDSTDNCITDNGAGIARNGSGPAVPVTFVENWWGADSGPGGSGGGNGDSIPGAVTHQPFLTKPPTHCGDVPVAPALTLSPTEIDFGDVEFGSTGGPVPVTMQNLGNGTASTLLFILADSGNDFDFNAGDCGLNLPSGESCQITFTFAPNQAGNATALLRVLASGEERASLDLSGNGVAATIDVDPESFGFEVVTGGQDARTLTLGNLGDADLDWNVIPAETGQCNDPNDIPWLGVSPETGFTPPAGEDTAGVTADTADLLPGEYHAQLCVHSNDPDQQLVTIPVELHVTAPELSFDPPSLDFGEVEIDAGGAALPATLHNTGDADATDLVFSLTGDDFSVDTADCGVMLPAGESCEIEASFSPQQDGPALAILEASSGDFSAAAELTGTGTAALIEVDPALFEFELVTGQSGNQTLAIANPGNIGLDWSIAAVPNCAAGGTVDWLQISSAEGTTEPGGATPIEISADAATLPAGLFEAELCITSNALSMPELALPVTLTVTAPDLLFDPPELDFGDVEVDGDGLTLNATLHNGGDAEATGLAFGVSNSTFSADTTDCGTGLPAGGSCTVAVTFLPLEPAPADAVLETSSNQGAAAGLPLSGTGIAAVLELDPASFALELVTGQNDTRTLSIGNAGNINLDWNITIEPECGAGGGAGWLDADPAAGITAPGNTTPVGVMIDAAGLAAGVHEAVLCITGNASGSPQTAVPVTLTVTAPGLAFDPPALDFGDVEIDTGGHTLTATLHNHGDSDATELDFLVPGGFDTDTTACGDSLAADESCEIAVTFNPTETGTVDGLLIAGSAEGAAAELELAGNGTAAGTLGTDPGLLHFDDIVITTTRTLGFAVTNTAGAGADPIELASLSLESGGPAFAIDHVDCMSGTVLAPGESCAVQISFTPVEVAVHKGMVRITASDGQKVTVPLSGTVLGDSVFADRFEQP